MLSAEISYCMSRHDLAEIVSDKTGNVTMIKRKGPTTMQLDMTKGRPLPVILRFTIPLVIGNVFQQLYNMAYTIIVGRYVGAGALAAVGSTGTIMFLTTGFAQGIFLEYGITEDDDTEAVRNGGFGSTTGKH